MNVIRKNAPILIMTALTFGALFFVVALAQINESKVTKSQTVDPGIFINETTHIRGETAAPVTLVEFSDFECPACGSFAPYIKALESEYKGKVKVVFKHYPLNFHKNARKAAEAAEAAGAQGKFWEYHDLLYSNQKDLSIENLKKLAQELELDMNQFNSDLESGKFGEVVSKDIELGDSLNVEGTPTFYINGKFVNLRSASDLKEKVEEELNTDN